MPTTGARTTCRWPPRLSTTWLNRRSGLVPSTYYRRPTQPTGQVGMVQDAGCQGAPLPAGKPACVVVSQEPCLRADTAPRTVRVVRHGTLGCGTVGRCSATGGPSASPTRARSRRPPAALVLCTIPRTPVSATPSNSVRVVSGLCHKFIPGYPTRRCVATLWAWCERILRSCHGRVRHLDAHHTYTQIYPRLIRSLSSATRYTRSLDATPSM